MRKINRSVVIVWISLLLAACTPQFAPTATLLPSTPSGVPPLPALLAARPTATPTGVDLLQSAPTLHPENPAASPSGPPTIQGQFRLTNTSQPGMDVGVETLDIRLEARQPGATTWDQVETSCSFTPPAPVVLKDQLDIQYECRLAGALPASTGLRAFAEVTVFGSDMVFRIEIDLP